MEEEDEFNILDYRSPKGQLIKLLEQKLKKPEIDECLGQVLDKFNDLVNEQTTFLDNGIFHMNFAEDALLLQSCGQLYAKRVDKLWDDLLNFHTRMVKYDEPCVKNSGDNARKEARKLELMKLEERLNRGKRKKITLVEPDNQPSSIDDDDNSLPGQDILIGSDLFEECENEEDIPFNFNFDMFDEWHEIQRLCDLEKKKHPSVLVLEYSKQKYRLKPYSIPCGDQPVYDLEDPEEFNTREGRLISCQHIRHLFEYNDRCLLPDDGLTVGKLRFAYVLKKRWLVRNKIDPDAPYETYKEAYEKYQRDFFENEKRKVQNMPQRNSEDLLKFYKVLERKEQIAREAQDKLRKQGITNLPEISFENLIVEPLKEGYEGDYDPYIPEDMDISADHETELSNLFVDLPKNPTESTGSDKLRADSGYFDGGFEADDESDHEESGLVKELNGDEPIIENVDASVENSEATTNNDNDINKTTETNNNIVVNDSADINDTINALPNGDEADKLQANETFDSGIGKDNSIDINNALSDVLTENSRPDVLSQISDIVNSDHDGTYQKYDFEDVIVEKTDDMIVIIYKKDTEEKALKKTRSVVKKIYIEKEKKEQPKTCLAKAEPEKISNLQKRKLDDESMDSEIVPIKRRKLSKKQIEKLKQSLIESVKEQKFDNFYSMNYQSEKGEGEVIHVDYESDLEENDGEEPVIDYHSDHEGSHLSDHDYCLPGPESNDILNSTNELDSSGFHETSSINFSNTDLIAEMSKNTGISQEEILKRSATEKEPLNPREEERIKSRERVSEWRDHITPKLKSLNENDFDIHEYGSKIMDSMSVNETKPFSDLVDGKSSAEVVRCFISTLQLANTMNVEICGAKSGELSNDTFQIKLLSKERYHEHFQEYQAPSEENLRDKLEKVKQIRKDAKLHEKSKSSKRTEVVIKSIKMKTHSHPYDWEQPSTSRQADKIDQQMQVKTYKKSVTKRSAEISHTPSKKIKVLNSLIVNCQQIDVCNYQLPSISQNSTEMEVEPNYTEPHQTPSRHSIDSGFMPFDDDIFDQQESSDGPFFHSTPVKSKQILSVRIEKQ